MIKFSAESPPLFMGRRRRTIFRRGVRHLWASIFGCGSQAAARGLAQGSRSGRRKDAAKGRAFHVARRAACGGVADRKSVVEGKSVSVRVDLGGRRSIKKKMQHPHRVERSSSMHRTILFLYGHSCTLYSREQCHI